MRRLTELLATLTPKSGPTPPCAPSASGFLTIGATTYIDPHGIYPLDHRMAGAPTLIANDTDHPIAIVTERNHGHLPAVPWPPSSHLSPTDLVLAPGERTETRRGDCVHVG
ncbi:hypothetical protein ACWD6P_00350 [Streptomyces sp. NPDC002446]